MSVADIFKSRRKLKAENLFSVIKRLFVLKLYGGNNGHQPKVTSALEPS